jgi:hypothetical protein
MPGCALIKRRSSALRNKLPLRTDTQQATSAFFKPSKFIGWIDDPEIMSLQDDPVAVW